MSAPSQSVFISYTREDLAAARRIADALSAFEVEVWFDEEGLEGGDAWDQKIRRQIKECSLFIPVISAQTQARREAYFRLEWKLAEERTHLMAEGTAFLLPIAIDGTPEAGALVPDSFLRAQWMRLPRGVPNTEFVDRVRALLETQRRAPASPAAAAPAVAAGAGMSWKKLTGAVIAAGAVIMAVWSYWPKDGSGPAAARPIRAAPVADKSIAVLPFINMSEDKENAFFTDGMHEDILTHLANLGELKVISRTSVMAYRDTKKPLRQIGAELGVAFILEGSVRRVGNKVRVTGQLIDARTEGHLWSKYYDKDVSDVFAIQSALATEIATALNAVLSPREKALLARTPTSSSAAYELYLKARDILNREGRSDQSLPRVEALLQSALELDAKFVAAWGELAKIHLFIYHYRGDATAARLAKARQAIETMERLAPDAPETWIALSFYSAELRDYPRATSYLLRAARVLPNNADVVRLLCEVDKSQGRWSEALTHHRQAYQLDPLNRSALHSLAAWLRELRRYDEAVAFINEHGPAGSNRDFLLASLAFFRSGSTRELATFSAANPDSGYAGLSAMFIGSAADYVRLADEARRRTPNDLLGINTDSFYASALMALGETTRAREVATRNLARIKVAVGADLYVEAQNLAVLGDKQAALESLAAEHARYRKDGFVADVLINGWLKPFILVELGEKEAAMAEFARLLKVPCMLNVHLIRRSWYTRHLQGDPAFEAMVNDPANNAPLL